MSNTANQTAYVLEYVDDCGGNLHPAETSLYLSIPSLVAEIERLVNSIKTDYGWIDDFPDSHSEEDVGSYPENLYYYNPNESMIGLTPPSLEYITGFLNGTIKDDHSGLIIKIGNDIGYAASFACEIRVYARKIKS